MREGIDLSKWEPIRAGVRVRLKPDVSEALIRALAPEILPDTPYLVYAVTQRDDGNHTVWMGPEHPEYREFDVEAADPRFKDVRPVSVHHLEAVGD